MFNLLCLLPSDGGVKGRQGYPFLSSGKLIAGSHQVTFERSHAAGWQHDKSRMTASYFLGILT